MSDSYPQFLNVEDCDERLRRLEQSKDARITQQQKQIESLTRALQRAEARAEVRTEVHRDDYLRSGHLIAGLYRIMELSPEEVAVGRAGDIATEVLHTVWGVTLPPNHCDNHSRYHPTCPECRALAPSSARGDENGRTVPKPPSVDELSDKIESEPGS